MESVSPRCPACLALLQVLRPHQWMENAFALAPLVFAGALRDPVRAGRAPTARLGVRDSFHNRAVPSVCPSGFQTPS